ncbi:hypothetical protein EMPS_02820 [Entomortierella parvispora]|uniref:Uncharacterized protein n=1 Tax=Entomortierella parvispora TaxID=205924 RepID=A0A9P3H5H7_9FUNG|nr:hypothetical protein EMPS_02820 [Entomortierella parvispora]
MEPFPPLYPTTAFLSPLPAFPTSTTKHAKITRPLPTTAEPIMTWIPDNGSKSGSGGSGMSGGAVAGLVIGVLVILIGSIVGGFMLLKKRRERLMVSGRGYSAGAGYPEVSNRSVSKREALEDDDDEKSGGGNGGSLAGLFSGLFGQTRKVVGGSSGNRGIVQRRSAAAAGPIAGGNTGGRRQQQSWAMTPTGGAPLNSSTGEPLLSGMEQQQPHQYPLQQQLHQARMASPSPSFPTHQSGSLPPSGPLALPVSGYAGGPGYSPAGMNAYVQPLQGITPEQRITAPASQPYVYQPGTGLVSVPVMMPQIHQQQQQPNPYQQQQQQQQLQHTTQPPVQYIPTPFQPPVPEASPNSGNMTYNAWPATVATPSLVSTQNQPYQHQLQQQQQQQQQQHYQQQQQQQQYQAQQQQQYQAQQQQQHPVAFPPPPTASARSATPESTSVFLPGDASRPLLGQGLFKIVPDSEDDEEAARVRAAVAAAAAAAATDDQRPESRASAPPPLDLNLGGDFLSSVLNYENQDQRFQSLRTMSERAQDQQPLRPVTPLVEDMANTMTSEEFEEYKRTPGYHDRLAGQKDRPKNQPRYLVDKEEVMNGQRANQHIRDESEIVIVGSDVVLEPLPSAKAAAAAASESGSARATPSPYHPSQQRQSYPLGTTDSGAPQSPSKEHQAPRTTLTRQATIGEFLPTIGTEEYLERTDDKEEYSFKLHGDASSSVDGGTSRMASPLIHHPATRIAPAAGAAQLQADGFSPPVSPASSAAAVAYRPMADLSRPSIIESPSSSPQPPPSPTINNLPPPSIVRSTKPKFN